MAKLTLSTITSGYSSVAALNANFAAIATAFENTLSRDGTTPNDMSGNIDMGGNRILNLGAPGNDYDPVRLIDLSDSDATGAASATLRSDLAASTGSSLVGHIASGSGPVARTVQGKLREAPRSPEDHNAVGDSSTVNSGTDDSAEIQSALDATPQWSLAAIAGTPGSAVLGGGILGMAAKTLGHRLGVSINVTKSKVIIQGPGRLNLDDGVTALLFNYLGSSDKSGVIFRHLDFVGGAIAIDGGLNSNQFPWLAEHCNFINQTTASVKTGNNGFWIDIYRCHFAGNAKAIWHHGSSADGLNIERCVFQYNNVADFDILIDNGANVAGISFCDFIGNKDAGYAHVKFDMSTAQTGAYSIIERNKFGTESRTTGNVILITGSQPLIGLQLINNPIMGFDSSAPAGCIKVVGTPLTRCVIKNNGLVYATLFDSASTESNNTLAGENEIGPNFSEPKAERGLQRGNFNTLDLSEPTPDLKSNILAFSRYINNAAFTYSNVTPSYMTATDENSIANNASTFLATAVANIIRVNSVNTNNVQKKYTASVWAKMDVASDVTFRMDRGSDAAFARVVNIGTSWQRVVVEFYQTYLATGYGYVFDIVIPNGRTITLGGVCVVPGRDAGDLRKTNETTEYANGVITSSASPTVAIYWPAGKVAKNSAPALGQPKGWVCTVAGSPGTWQSEGNL